MTQNFNEELKPVQSFYSNSNSSTTTDDSHQSVSAEAEAAQQVPLSLLEKWLFEEGVNMMDMSLDADHDQTDQIDLF